MSKGYKPRRQSKRWLDGDCPDGVLAIYDNRGQTVDRYTVFYRVPIVGESLADMWLGSRFMSENPSSPQGIGIYGEMEAYNVASYRYRFKHRAARWSSLPEPVKRLVRDDCKLEES